MINSKYRTFDEDSSSPFICEFNRLLSLSRAFITKHKANLAIWSAGFTVLFFFYHLFSDGDFSFFLVSALGEEDGEE